MRNLILLGCSAGLVAGLSAYAQPAAAHAVVGNRFFPATLVTDDPGVADELSLPTVSSFKTGDDPAARELDVSGEYSKRLTSRLGVSFGETWTQLKAPDAGKSQGFQNLETTVKYQFVTSPEHEAILAVGLSAEWAQTGADQVGAERHSTFTPTFYFGKGAGELPDGLAWARPFAVTGLIGYALPGRSHDGPDANARVLRYGLALEYSFPYLSAHVKDYGLSDFVNHLTPLPVRPRIAVETLVLLLAPFAPHVAEELWQALGHPNTLAYEPWPTYDPALLVADAVEVPVQLNGKIRLRLQLPAGLDPAALEKAVMDHVEVKAMLAGKTIRKVIVVPKKLVNIVVG